jgi:hypothetical protein
VLDTSSLPTTSGKRNLHWREPKLSFLLIRQSGEITQAHLLEEKRKLAAICGPNDRLLALRTVQFPPHPEVLWVDDLEEARAAVAER